VDGVFGAGTNSAVRSFQSAQGLGVDGIVGDNTWNKMVW
jgi:peptidoglycan hydrolase-like protein with peptidoglycan-binding domain